MKDISQVSAFIDRISNDIEKKVIKAQRETAKLVWEDVVSKAPMNTGDYIASIKVSDTKVEGNTISTEVYTDATVSTLGGKTYNLGMLLETGTDPHAIPNAFGWGNIYGYESKQYKRTLQPDWHPGTTAQEHFKPALDKNAGNYIENIRKAIGGK